MKRKLACTKAPSKENQDQQGSSQDSSSSNDINSSSSSEGSNSASSDDESCSDLEGQVIPIEFDFYGFVESDFYAIKRFLSLILGTGAGDQLSGFNPLADFIIEQQVGNSVKCGDEESQPFAICSVVRISGPQQPAENATGPLQKFLKQQFATHTNLINLLESRDQGVGLLVYDRLINTPWQISAPLFRLLHEELSSLSKYQYLLVLCPLFVPKSPKPKPELNIKSRAHFSIKKKQKQASKTTPVEPLGGLIHTFLELEYLEQVSEFSFDFAGSAADPNPRRAVVVAVDKLPQLIETLDRLVLDSDELINQERVVA